MRVYIDTCCWGRPWDDDQGQASTIAEADAMEEIIERRRTNNHLIIGSPLLDAEILKNPDAEDRDEIMMYYEENIGGYIEQSPEDDIRAAAFQSSGLKANDSYHLAFAERAGAVALLTVDKKFIRIAANKNLSRVKVTNPLIFRRLIWRS